MGHTCNPSTLGGWGKQINPGVQDQPGKHGETPFLQKIQKISQAWWHVPVVPATWEAKVGGSLEPWRQRLQWTVIVPLHCALAWVIDEALSQKPTNKKRKWKTEVRVEGEVWPGRKVPCRCHRDLGFCLNEMGAIGRLWMTGSDFPNGHYCHRGWEWSWVGRA